VSFHTLLSVTVFLERLWELISYINRYWGVFWIDASTDENAQAAFATLGNRAKKDSTFESGKFWLASQSKPWLLVIDNADDPSMDISRYIPAGNFGHILITTRNPNNVMHATVGEKQFRDMEPDDAVSLLLKAADLADSDSQHNSKRRSIAFHIAKALGYLALALVHVGATIQRKICRLEEYLTEYTKNRKEMMMSGIASSADSSSMTIIATWEVSYKRIESLHTTEAKDATDILRIFAFLHFEHIPEALFEKAWSERQAQTTQSSPDPSLFNRMSTWLYESTSPTSQVEPMIFEQAGPRWNRSRFRQALALLSDHSLIYYDAKRSMCSMHPVIHAWARDRLSRQAQIQWLNATASILSWSITPTLEASGREYRRLLSPHIDTCLDMGDIRIDDHVDRGARILKFASVYAECGRWKSAAQIQRHVIEVRRRACGANHSDTIEAMDNLGQTCWNLFNPREALEVQMKILQASMGTFTWLRQKGISTLKTLSDLGRTYWLLGNRREAERLGSMAVQGLTKKLGDQDPATLTAMQNLACTYNHLSRPERATELLEHVLKTRLLYWGLRHDETLATMNELSMAYLGLGRQRYSDAEQLCRKALQMRISILGEEHAYTLWSVNNLSKICCARGYYDEAARMLEKILPVVIRTLGKAHVGMTMTIYNLACAYAGQTKWSKAENLLKMQLEYIPTGHPDWVSYVSELARVCESGGHELEAQGLCIQAVQRYGVERALRSETPAMERMVRRLYRICVKRGQLEDRSQLRSYLHSLEAHSTAHSSFDVEQNSETFVTPPEPDDRRSTHSSPKIHTSKTW
jgi:tetratricopeptide (TPR) repeat protein